MSSSSSSDDAITTAAAAAVRRFDAARLQHLSKRRARMEERRSAFYKRTEGPRTPQERQADLAYLRKYNYFAKPPCVKMSYRRSAKALQDYYKKKLIANNGVLADEEFKFELKDDPEDEEKRPSKPAKSNVLQLADFRVGDVWLTLWDNGKLYKAAIVSIPETRTGTFNLLWDGNFTGDAKIECFSSLVRRGKQ